jgi:dihydrofolate reductase
MGRKTYDSIGKPLDGRTNVVLSKNDRFNPPGVIVARSMEEALSHNAVYDRPVWIIGGADIYTLGLRCAHAIEQTLVLDRFKCDTFFPNVQLGRWKESWRGERVKSSGGPSFRVITYVREDEPH